MQYVTNYMDVSIDPVDWARRREDQGWDLVSVADHFMTGRPFPHVWVTAGAIAAATERVGITTAFVNNLFRNPVEVAQAALMAQLVSDGRFELGLGAGWMRGELEAAGMAYPEPAERAGRFAEAAAIVRSLLHTGSCHVDGEHYTIAVDGLGPLSDAPPLLIGSVGGPRTVREVTPHCDRVEIKASSASTRGGSLDFEVMATVTDDHLVEMIGRVRAIDPDIAIGMFVLCNAGDDPTTKRLEEMLGDGLYGRFYGAPEKIVENLAWLGELGISRCQISPHDDTTFDRLAPLLYL